MAIRWGSYPVMGLYDELIQDRSKPRPAARQLCQFLHSLSDKEIEEHKSAADLAIKLMGITFTVDSEQDGGAIDRAWPFDIIPRMEAGLTRTAPVSPTTEFLFKERRFPRAILHCLGEIEGCSQTLNSNAKVVASIRDVVHTVENVNPGALSQDELHRHIDLLQLGLANIDEVVRETYFA